MPSQIRALLLRKDGENVVGLDIYPDSLRIDLTPSAAELLLYDLHPIMQTLRGLARPADPTLRDRLRAAVKAFRTP